MDDLEIGEMADGYAEEIADLRKTIDALVAALTEVRPILARTDGIPGSHAEARLARVDAALALARGKPPE